MKVRGVYGGEARMFTWECVSPFDGEIPPEKREALFRTEFPDVCGKVVFREMVAFNDAEGRRHRYLVIFPMEEMPNRCVRMIPRMALLYGYADKLMRSREDYGNFRVAFWTKEKLYILVFCEGRLCHWAEEMVQREASTELTESVELPATRRVEFFDEFLKQDALFSREKEFQRAFVPMDDGCDGEWESCFWQAARDSFWKKMNLGGMCSWMAFRKWKTHVALLIFCVIILVWNFAGWEESVPVNDVIPPELTAFPYVEESLEPRVTSAFDKPIFLIHPRKSYAAPACNGSRLKLQGIVSGRIVQVNVDGDRRWARLQDSLGDFRVESIDRDRVKLGCGGNLYEIRADRI